MIYFLLSICSKLNMEMLKVACHNALLFMIICSFRRPPSNCGFYAWFDPEHGPFMKNLVNDLVMRCHL
jgi:hypothetical protein